MHQELTFTASADPGQVCDVLATRYEVRIGTRTTTTWTVLDTADWRLHDAGLTLREQRDGRTSELVLRGAGAREVAAPSRGSWPRPVTALPASAVRDRIEGPVGIRALLPRAEVAVRCVPLSVLDDEGKTRVRVRVDQHRLVGRTGVPVQLHVLVSGLRGYDRDAERCVALLTDALDAVATPLDSCTAAVLAAGHTPGRPVGPLPDLDPQAPAGVSLARILLAWGDRMTAALPGSVDDVDPEFVHDLRTSVRATRSLLRLGADLLPSSSGPVRQALREMTHASSPLRDLDLQLLALAGRADLDVSDVGDLDPLRRELGRRRRAALAGLRARVRSTRLEAVLDDWRHSLTSAVSSDLPGPVTATVARAQLSASYADVRTAAAAAARADASTETLHDLRRTCKRLRYALDAYESLCEPEALRDVRHAVKRLQDRLGTVQDCVAFGTTLVEAAHRLHRNGAPAEILLDIGTLRERLRRRLAAERDRLDVPLHRVGSKAVRAQARALVGGT